MVPSLLAVGWQAPLDGHMEGRSQNFTSLTPTGLAFPACCEPHRIDAQLPLGPCRLAVACAPERRRRDCISDAAAFQCERPSSVQVRAGESTTSR